MSLKQTRAHEMILSCLWERRVTASARDWFWYITNNYGIFIFENQQVYDKLHFLQVQWLKNMSDDSNLHLHIIKYRSLQMQQRAWFICSLQKHSACKFQCYLQHGSTMAWGALVTSNKKSPKLYIHTSLELFSYGVFHKHCSFGILYIV